MLEESKDQLPVENTILAKIYSNIASIYVEIDRVSEAIKLYASSLRLKRQRLPEHHSEIEAAYSNLGDAYSKAENFTDGYDFYDHAYEISKNLNGKTHKNTAKYILNCAKMKFKSDELEDALKLYEYAAKLYHSVEKGLGKQGKLICLKLIDLYSHVRNDIKADALTSDLLENLENAKNKDDKYTLYNDLANIQKKNDQHKLAIEIYKKALQTVKQVHRNNYMYLKPTSKILINLADTYTQLENHQSSVRYLEHALNVMNNTHTMANAECAKVQIKLAEAQNRSNMVYEAVRNYEQALDVLENIPAKSAKVTDYENKARVELRTLRRHLAT